MVAPNKSLLSTWKDAMLQSMRRSAGHGTYTIVGLGYPRGGKIITMDSPSGVVQEILRDDSKWQTMGGTEPLTQELVKKYSDKMGGHTDLIYYTDALEYDGYGLAAETFGAEHKANLELIPYVYVEGIGIMSGDNAREHAPRPIVWDGYTVVDDSDGHELLDIPADGSPPLQDGEIELIEAMIYGYDHPQINDGMGEFNVRGMFWTIQVMELLANYNPADYQSEFFGAEAPSYMADSDAHKLMEASWRINSFVESTEEYPQWWKSKLSVAASNVDDLADYLDYAMSDDYDAETFGADEVAYAVMWEGKEDDNEGLIYGIEYMDGEEVSDVEWFATAKERDAELKSYIEEFGAESKFDKLAKEIAADYRKKGKSPEEALEIGEATAAKIGRAKFGKKKFARMGKKAENFYGAEQKGTTASGHKVEYDDGSFYMEFAEPIQGYDSVGGSWYGGDNELPDDIDLQVYHANEDYDNFEISISDVEYYGVSQNKRNRWRLDNDSRGNGPDIFVDMSDELVEAIEEGLNWMLGDLEDIMGVRYGAESVTNTLLPAFGLAAVGALVYTIFLNGKKE